MARIKTRAHLIAARLQLHEHDNLTAKFLKRDDNCKSVLGDHWKEKWVSFRAKHRLLQSISFQFPCAANFKKWGWQESQECRLCKALFPKQPAFTECVGHIQGYCKALQKPRIAVHHGIWRDLIRHIGKQSLEEHEHGSRIVDLSHISQCRQARGVGNERNSEHMCLMTNTQLGRSDAGKEITLFHCAMGYWDTDDLTDSKVQVFLKIRPDGVAFNMMARKCVFLEFTRPMDSRDGSSEQPDWYTGADWSLDWAQDKDLEKDTRYTHHRWASWKKGTIWLPNTTWESEASLWRPPGRTGSPS